MSSADSFNIQGTEFYKKGDLEAARIHYLAALRVNPWHFSAIMNLCEVLNHRNQITAAAALMVRATALYPDRTLTWNNRGNLLKRLERYNEAGDCLELATSCSPDDAAAQHNLLLLRLRQGRVDEAIKCYEKIRDLGSDSLLIQNDIAHAYLILGDLKTALPIYEARWASLVHLEPWDLHIPEWKGEDLTKKRILIHHEQGYGDTLMTSRFVRDLAKSVDCELTFAVPGTLIRLFDSQDWGVEVIDIASLREGDAKKFDFHSPIYSMMRWMGVEKGDISGEPYLIPPLVTCPPVYSSMFNVGICWSSGYRGNKMDWRRRVSPLEDWLTLAEVPGVQLWSLCPGEQAQNDIVRLGAEALVLDHVTDSFDFAETAAFISQLDLVITVDTAVAHLAAAMGKETIVLSQFWHCWRWWDLENETGKPWYDEMNILPQIEPGDWKSQLTQCKAALEVYTEIAKVQLRAAE